MQNGSPDLETGSLTPLHWVGIVLAVLTGIVHLALGLATITQPLGVASVLAAGGFAGAIAFLLVNYRRRLIIALGIPFVGGQIVLWYVINDPASLGDISPIEAFDKTVQLLLIGVLILLLARESAP